MLRYLDIPITVMVTATLTVAMLWPTNQPPPGPGWSDKVLHLIAFAALSFPLARTKRFGLIPVFIGGSVFGGIIEAVQPSFGRSADLQDLLRIFWVWSLELQWLSLSRLTHHPSIKLRSEICIILIQI